MVRSCLVLCLVFLSSVTYADDKPVYFLYSSSQQKTIRIVNTISAIQQCYSTNMKHGHPSEFRAIDNELIDTKKYFNKYIALYEKQNNVNTSKRTVEEVNQNEHAKTSWLISLSEITIKLLKEFKNTISEDYKQFNDIKLHTIKSKSSGVASINTCDNQLQQFDVEYGDLNSYVNILYKNYQYEYEEAKEQFRTKYEGQPVIEGFTNNILRDKQITQLEKRKLTGAFDLDARIGSRTNYFNNDNKTSPNYGMSLYVEKLFIFMDLFSDIDFGNVVYKDNAVDLSTTNSVGIKVGLYIPLFANVINENDNYFYNKKTEFRTGVIVKQGYNLLSGGESDKNAIYLWGVGVRSGWDRLGYIEILYGENEAVTNKRVKLGLSIPILSWNKEIGSALILRADGDFAAHRGAQDDIFTFGIDLTLPINKLRAIVSPILPSLGKSE